MEVRQLMVRSADPRSGAELPNLDLIDGVVAAKIVEAMYAASEALKTLGVRHALVGGLAVGSHGHPRATKDVDFLVGEEAFEHHGPIVSIRAGVPIRVGDVAVDPISIGSATYLETALDSPHRSNGVPVVPLPALIAMKIGAGRMQDLADVAELIKAGSVDVDKARQYLRDVAPALGARFEMVVTKAAQE